MQTREEVQPPGPQQAGKLESAKAPKEAPTDRDVGYFWDTDNGIYFTYTKYEMKQALCRAAIKFVVLMTVFLVFYMSWDLCDYCILFTALGSCGGSFAGLRFLSVPCWSGVVACLLRGFTIGNEVAQVQVHWKI